MTRLILCLPALLLTACSPQQLYGGGQAWQKNECSKLADAAERKRCMDSTQKSFEDYRAEADKVARRP